MARRRGKTSLIDVLVQLPWPFSIAVGLVLFVVMRWVVPSVFANNLFLSGLVEVVPGLAWMPLLGFCVVALLAFLRARKVADKPASAPASKPASTSSPRPKKSADRKLPQIEGIPDISNRPSLIEKIDEWTLPALRKLEWKRFEMLCAGYYEAVGFRCETLSRGADGGIDVKLFKGESTDPLAVVQCKAWKVNQVGVKEIRELLGVMANAKVARGVFITTSNYTKAAVEFGATNRIQLLDGTGFVTKIRDLPQGRQDALLQTSFEGDYATPSCASCGVKTVMRESKRGSFWGCPNFPRCRTMLRVGS